MKYTHATLWSLWCVVALHICRVLIQPGKLDIWRNHPKHIDLVGISLRCLVVGHRSVEIDFRAEKNFQYNEPD